MRASCFRAFVLRASLPRNLTTTVLITARLTPSQKSFSMPSISPAFTVSDDYFGLLLSTREAVSASDACVFWYVTVRYDMISDNTDNYVFMSFVFVLCI